MLVASNSSPPEIAAGTHIRSQNGTETIPVFSPADGEASQGAKPEFGLLYYQAESANQKNTMKLYPPTRIPKTPKNCVR